MKPANQTIQQDSLTEFDRKMIQEMKKIPEFKNWTDQQLAEYSSILNLYSLLIVSSVRNEKQNSDSSSALTLISGHHRKAA